MLEALRRLEVSVAEALAEDVGDGGGADPGSCAGSGAPTADSASSAIPGSDAERAKKLCEVRAMIAEQQANYELGIEQRDAILAILRSDCDEKGIPFAMPDFVIQMDARIQELERSCNEVLTMYKFLSS